MLAALGCQTSDIPWVELTLTD